METDDGDPRAEVKATLSELRAELTHIKEDKCASLSGFGAAREHDYACDQFYHCR